MIFHELMCNSSESEFVSRKEYHLEANGRHTNQLQPSVPPGDAWNPQKGRGKKT
jgi:hypothetical protein